MAGLSLYVECKPSIGTACCSFTSHGPFLGNLTIYPQAIVVALNSETICWNLRDLDCKFVVPSPPTHMISKENAYIRLQVNNEREKLGTHSSNIIQDKELTCNQCRGHVVDLRSFKRVLPLPSSDWGDLGENIFCHQGGYEQKIWPSAGDFLMGRFSALVHVKDIPGVEVQGRQVNCSSCNIILGGVLNAPSTLDNGSNDQGCELRDGVIELNCSLLTFTEGKLTQPVMRLEHAFASELIDHANRSLTYKFIVQHKNENVPVSLIMVWLLEVDVRIAYGCSQGNTDAFSAIKLLYAQLGDTSDAGVLIHWIKDPTVSTLTIPKIVSTRLIDLLAENSQKLPPSMQYAKGMTVSYLKTGE